MASRIRVQCPNCLTPYSRTARFCAACGRARDEKTVAGVAAEAADPNRSVMLTAAPRRSGKPARPVRATAPATPTPLSLPALKPGFVAFIAVLFFGLVWVGRWVNGPKKPPPPVAPALAAAAPNDARARHVQRQQEAQEKQDLQEAEVYAENLRAEAAAVQLQAHLRDAQAPPPSRDPKPFDVVPIHPLNNTAAVYTDSQGQAIPPR